MQLRPCCVNMGVDLAPWCECVWCTPKCFFLSQASFEHHVQAVHGTPFIERMQAVCVLKSVCTAKGLVSLFLSVNHLFFLILLYVCSQQCGKWSECVSVVNESTLKFDEF